MTIEEIRKLEAGRELDDLIDRHVFGRDKTAYCETFSANRCDGVKRTICGACGGFGHGNYKTCHLPRCPYCRDAKSLSGRLNRPLPFGAVYFLYRIIRVFRTDNHFTV